MKFVLIGKLTDECKALFYAQDRNALMFDIEKNVGHSIVDCVIDEEEYTNISFDICEDYEACLFTDSKDKKILLSYFDSCEQIDHQTYLSMRMKYIDKKLGGK